MSDKLRYLGYPEKDINKIVNMNYDLIGRLSGQYKQLEKDIDQAYMNIKHLERNVKRTKFYREFKNQGLMN
ncbi:MAG TPA: hypothetical protein VJ912_01845 [Candidatus Nanoarchaeia archaeon]|nr:hypothetical protein [Candidatus Nanoarchaeia archaeon]